jgi:hypothetical protein
MNQITATPKKLQVNKEGKDGTESDKGMVTEQDFAEYHALLESQYEQVLSEINEEIMKRTQRLIELRKAFGSSSHL